jgi:hypothetical protein
MQAVADAWLDQIESNLKSVYVSRKGRPNATDCGTISPASTGTFVRMAYPLNAEFLTIRAGDTQFQFVGKSSPGARIWLKQSVVPQQDPFRLTGEKSTERSKSFDDSTGVSTTEAKTTVTVACDEALYYDNALQHLNAVSAMFVQKMQAR